MPSSWKKLQNVVHVAVGAFTIGCLLSSPAYAAPPQVRFDVQPVVECIDVTPPEFAQNNPDEKLIEARFEVSSLIGGSERDIADYLYVIDARQSGAIVVDYLPRTTLATAYASPISYDKKQEKSGQIGVTAKGSYSLVDGNGTATVGRKNSLEVKYELLPPQEQVLASGSIGRSTGAYFKLKPSNQTSLEGGREFVLMMKAPVDWRVGLARVRCAAHGIDRGLTSALDQNASSGSADFTLVIFAAGDTEAKWIAQEFMAADYQLRRTAYTHRATIEKNALPSLKHRFGVSLGLVDRELPSDWLSQGLASPETTLDLHGKHLPQAVRSALTEYALARTKLLRLNRWRDRQVVATR